MAPLAPRAPLRALAAPAGPEKQPAGRYASLVFSTGLDFHKAVPVWRALGTHLLQPPAIRSRMRRNCASSITPLSRSFFSRSSLSTVSWCAV